MDFPVLLERRDLVRNSHQAASRVTKYLVVSFGGTVATGKPSPVWFLTSEQAKTEIKRRLGVERLHEAARFTAASFGSDERISVHEGHEWRCVFTQEYSTVPASHPEFRRAGGFRLCEMERPAEPFTNPFIQVSNQ